MMAYNTYTLESGLRIIHLPTADNVIYCGIAVMTGTRDEQQGQEGLAHFCEHLAFKGTSRRSAVQIINALEGVGGELNAFTNKEDTVYYCAILRDHFRKAVDVLCDIVFNSTHPQAEVEKEREVVCDEIESYEDSPAELIYDDLENLLFDGHPLGHNILGTSRQLRTYNHDDTQRFVHQHYRPDNCVFFASGNIDFHLLVRLLQARGERLEVRGERIVSGVGEESALSPLTPHLSPLTAHLSPLTPHLSPLASHPSPPVIRNRGTHQAHVMIGALAYPADDRRRWSLYLLNNILGGPGLNSRLNLVLRERNALVYTVESAMCCYSDTGLWSVYFGCDPQDVDCCLHLVRRELDRLVDKPLSDAQMRRAKQQLQGQLAIASDNREQFALDFAKNYLHSGKLRDLSDIMRHIDTLTAASLQQTAQEIMAEERLTTLIYQ
ncbi:MAG: insulinase family protein [Prevotella sp.]|nr:insulinase family protein [Prevotella sp.]